MPRRAWRVELMGYVTMKTFLKTFLADESGASAAEYALILAVVGLGIAVAGVALGGTIKDSMCSAADTIDTANTDAGGTSTATLC